MWWSLPCVEFNKFFYFLFGFIVVYLSKNERYKCIYRALVTLPRDLDIAVSMGYLLLLINYYDFRKWSTVDLFRRNFRRHPKKTAFICGEKSTTYQDVEDFSNRVARHFKSKGLQKEEAVAILLETRCEYPAVWLGLSKLGAIGALINTNQRSQVLEHSIRISGAKYLVYGTELTPALEEIKDSLKGITLYSFGDGNTLPGSLNFLEEISKESSEAPEPADIKITDRLLYIYTSGTTGLPKAAIMTHARFWVLSLAAIINFRIKESDIIYDPLPLYHSAGGLLGVSQVFINGATVVLRPKFSASNFWTDCIKYKCTVAQYIGEICRYVLSQPPRPTDRQHSVRVVFGNGLKAQVWEPFVQRFGIKRVGEFYGATEGNAATVNAWNHLGACGYIPWFAKPFYPVALIRVSEETNEPLRGSDGLCIRCKQGEPGLLVGKIQKRPTSHFNGYIDKESTEKKILRDVFKKGDSVFNTGDILMRDEYGYMFFKDRTGDTFRWRGENVSTSEVEGIISHIIGLKDATVYGVQIPHNEGKAGMAAIVDPDQILNLDKLSEGIQKNLPSYARPMFIRVIHSIPMTSTFKIQKTQLQREAYDINKVKDPIYIYSSNESKYIDFTQQLHSVVMSGNLRV